MANKQEYLESEKELRHLHGNAVVNKAIENLECQNSQPLVKCWSEQEGSEGKPLTRRKHVAEAEYKKKRISYPKKYFCMYKR